MLDNKQPVDNKRPYARCGEISTKKGYYVCLGYIEGAEHGCYDHGIEEGYVILKNGRRIRLIDEN